MEVFPGIHRIEIPYQNRYLCQHILVSETKLLFIDAGIATTPSDVLIPYVRKHRLDENKEIYLLITHCDADHCGGASNLKKHYPNLVIMSHLYERPYIEDIQKNLSYRYSEFDYLGVKRSKENYKSILKNLYKSVNVDIGLIGDEEIRLDDDWIVQIIFSPGHTSGHVLVYCPKNKCAIITDAILGNGIYSREGDLVLCPTYRYTGSYLNTIEKIANLDLDVLYTSHFPVIKGKKKIREFIMDSKEFVFLVEAYIVEKLNEHGEVDLNLLIKESKDRLGPRERKIDQYYCLQGGLEWLAERGTIKENQSFWRKL